MAESIGHKAAKGAIWAALDRFGTMGVQFVVNLVLARLLVPEDFGIIGMLAIFIAVCQTLIEGGFSTALIQKKNPTQEDYSTILYWDIAFSTFLYLILFLCAPLIARFYEMPVLAQVLRVIALSLIVTGMFAVQRTRLQKQLEFKKIAFINLSAYAIAAVAAIVLAKHGGGVWSIVTFQLTYGVASVIIILLVARWLPSWCFSKKSFRQLFGFGGFIMAANILQTISQNLQGIIIGKKFSATQMGYFSQAYKLDQVTSFSLPQIIVQVMYPVYSSVQDDKERLRQILLMNVRVISFMVFGLLGLLMVLSVPIIDLLYGDKWLPCAPYFSILCIGGLFSCLLNVNFYAVAAVGRSRQLFVWSFYKWGFLLVALIVGALAGMYGILWAMVLSNLNIYIVNAHLVSKYVGLRLRLQLQSLIPAITVLILSTVLAYVLISVVELNAILVALSFMCVYCIGSLLINKRSVEETKIIVKKIFERK